MSSQTVGSRAREKVATVPQMRGSKPSAASSSGRASTTPVRPTQCTARKATVRCQSGARLSILPAPNPCSEEEEEEEEYHLFQPMPG